MTVTRGTFRGAIEISNYYICDYCRKRIKDLGTDVLCEHTWPCAPKKVMHDGIERPTDVCKDYEPRRRVMRVVKVPEHIEPWRIVCAAQSEPDYSEDRQILLYGGNEGDYHGNGPFIVLDGSHCSCFDWEEVEWYATEYDRDEILTLAKSKTGRDGCYSKSERMFWKMVLHSVAGSSLGMMS